MHDIERFIFSIMDLNGGDQPWIARNIVVVLRSAHNFPKHLILLLPKYDTAISNKHEDHIKKFILEIRRMNVQHEDVVC